MSDPAESMARDIHGTESPQGGIHCGKPAVTGISARECGQKGDVETRRFTFPRSVLGAARRSGAVCAGSDAARDSTQRPWTYELPIQPYNRLDHHLPAPDRQHPPGTRPQVITELGACKTAAVIRPPPMYVAVACYLLISRWRDTSVMYERGMLVRLRDRWREVEAGRSASGEAFLALG